jgi:hypothetical protein
VIALAMKDKSTLTCSRQPQQVLPGLRSGAKGEERSKAVG